MVLKKDKKKVLGEIFSDERIKTFLQFVPPEGVDADYHVLEKGYRGMKAENFEAFVKFFLADGRDINARNPRGETLLQVLRNHRQAEEYIEILQANGAI